MNLQLLNPFAHENFPERVDVSLDAHAQCVRFNSGTSRFAGNLAAIGRMDGCVSVLDMETRGYLRFLEGHVKAVTSLSWSRNSRYLLSASRDWNAIVWDLQTGERRDTIRFDAPVTSAVLHPRNSKIVLTTLQNQAEAVLVDLRSEHGGRWELDCSELQDEDESLETGASGSRAKATGSKRRRENATVARFSPRGDLIYVGSSLGMLYVFDTQTKTLVHTEKVSGGSSIKDFEFDQTGTSLVVNSNDRAIRVYGIDELAYYAYALPALSIAPNTYSNANASTSVLPTFLSLQHRFQDLVNRTPWNAIRFSNDGEYIVGGAGHKAAHQIYLWDRNTGNLSKILEGPKDPLQDVDWHPVRPACISASSDHGVMHIWVTNVTERWSAYAAGFEELEENLEYQEREDEFDVEDEDEMERRKKNKQEVALDVVSIEASRAAASLSALSAHLDLAEYLASSDEWADEGTDDDGRDDFALPLDVDLTEFELDESDIRDNSGPDTIASNGRR